MATEEAKPQAQTKAKTEVAKPEAEKQTNCLGCNKPIKKLSRYYRDGKFYCSKKCWKKNVKEKAKEAKKDAQG